MPLWVDTVAGEDYTNSAVVSGLAISYSIGETPLPKCAVILITDDNILEGDQEFTVTITRFEPDWALGSPSVGTVNSIDDG